MLYIKHLILTVFSVCIFSTSTLVAGPIGFGTSQQGTLTYTLGSAIARALFKVGDVRAAVQPNTGTGVMIPMVANNELDFGFANAIEFKQALEGEGVFIGRPNSNLKIVARLFPAQVGLLVREDSNIRSIKDLRGATITTGYQSTPILHDLIIAMLASENLTINDIEEVPVPSLIRGAEAFISGRAEVTFFAAGAGKVNEMNASVGGVRYIPLSAEENAVTRMQALIPQAYLSHINPRPGLAGIKETINLLTYDYTIFARESLEPEIVYDVIKTISENKDILIASSGAFRRMESDKLSMKLGFEFHQGAIQYYKDAGLWND